MRPVRAAAENRSADASASDFYVGVLGFREAWRHAEGGKLLVAQVERDGCELIFSCQWPERVGRGLIFISLDRDVLAALRAELEANGVVVRDGWWGYRLMVIDDPDGNQLYFPYETENAAPRPGLS